MLLQHECYEPDMNRYPKPIKHIVAGTWYLVLKRTKQYKLIQHIHKNSTFEADDGGQIGDIPLAD